MLYGGRSLDTTAFLDELTRYGDRITAVPQDRDGLLDLTAWLPEPGSDVKVYCCGPGPLLNALERWTVDHPAGQVRTERFVPAGHASPARGELFEVELRRSGVTVTVSPRQSVLDAVNAAGATDWCSTCDGHRRSRPLLRRGARRQDPLPFQRQLRDAGPVVHLSRHDAYAMSRREHVHAAVVTDREFDAATRLAQAFPLGVARAGVLPHRHHRPAHR